MLILKRSGYKVMGDKSVKLKHKIHALSCFRLQKKQIIEQNHHKIGSKLIKMSGQVEREREHPSTNNL